MYVIFPADEVVYLSYGRLIYVPNRPNPEGETLNPIRTNSLPSAVNNNFSCVQRDNIVANISAKKKPTGSERQEVPGTSHKSNLVLDRPSSSGAGESAEPNPKKKLLRLNFNLLKKHSSKANDSPFSPRLRKSIGHVEKIQLASPEEAFRKFCVIDSKNSRETSFSNHSSLPPLRENVEIHSTESQLDSKRSSSSSKTGKLFQEDKDSKRSSKHSTSSSKSGKNEKTSPHTPDPTNKQLNKAQSLVEGEPKSRKISTSSVPANDQHHNPLAISRRSIINSETVEDNSRHRKISTSSSTINDHFYPLGTSRRDLDNNKESASSSSSPFKFHLRRRSKSKTPEPRHNRPELDSQGFYPLSTSREKTLEEPLRDSPKKSRRSPFRLSFRRSKTPEEGTPSRPERKKDKHKEKQVVSSKPKTLERKLSFSDYLAVGRDRSETRPQEVLLLPPTGREKSKSKSPVLPLHTKSPVLNFFRKTPPSPRVLGRDRTPGILHTPHTPFFPPDLPVSNQNRDYSQFNSVHNSVDIPVTNSRSKPPTATGENI